MSKNFLLGFDVGGTKIEAVLLANSEKTSESSIIFDDGQERTYKVIDRQRVATEREKGYDSIIGKIADLGKKLLSQQQVDPRDLLGMGFGLPGTIDPKTHKMLIGNTGALVGQELATDLALAFKWDVPMKLANDANCFAFSEAMSGVGWRHRQQSGQSFRELKAIGIILGTGCGGGFVVNGQIYSGKHGGAAEFGHMTLVSNGRPCYCGRKGCAEQYLSGSAFTEIYGQADKIGSKEIFEKAKSGESKALAAVKEYRKNLAQFLGNLTCAFDPDFFVLGGGVSAQEIIYDGLEDLVVQRTFLPLNSVKIYSSDLGDSSGVIGAAFLPLMNC